MKKRLINGNGRTEREEEKKEISPDHVSCNEVYLQVVVSVKGLAADRT